MSFTDLNATHRLSTAQVLYFEFYICMLCYDRTKYANKIVKQV